MPCLGMRIDGLLDNSRIHLFPINFNRLSGHDEYAENDVLQGVIDGVRGSLRLSVVAVMVSLSGWLTCAGSIC